MKSSYIIPVSLFATVVLGALLLLVDKGVDVVKTLMAGDQAANSSVAPPPTSPAPPAVINWLDVPVQDPVTGRAMIMQVGLRNDGVVTWRNKP